MDIMSEVHVIGFMLVIVVLYIVTVYIREGKSAAENLMLGMGYGVTAIGLFLLILKTIEYLWYL